MSKKEWQDLLDQWLYRHWSDYVHYNEKMWDDNPAYYIKQGIHASRHALSALDPARYSKNDDLFREAINRLEVAVVNLRKRQPKDDEGWGRGVPQDLVSKLKALID